jgi:5-methylcytosine-specific restriction protein A
MKVIRITRKKQGGTAGKDPFYQSKAWKKFRKIYLAENPTCAECKKEGVITEATVVDHVIQRIKGGEDFDRNNLQPLCDRHHNIKRAQESNRSKAL